VQASNVVTEALNEAPVMAVNCAPNAPPFSSRASINEVDYYKSVPFQLSTDYCDIKLA